MCELQLVRSELDKPTHICTISDSSKRFGNNIQIQSPKHKATIEHAKFTTQKIQEYEARHWQHKEHHAQANANQFLD